DGAAPGGVHHDDAVAVAAGDEEPAVLREDHVVGVVADGDGGHDLHGGRVDYGDAVAGPVGAVEGGAVFAQDEVVGRFLDADARGFGAVYGVEGNDLAFGLIGGVEEV